MDYIAISSLIFTLFRTAADITTFLLSSPQRFSAMLTRTASRCSTKLRAALRQPSLRVAKQQPQCRRFSMPTANATPGAQSAATSSAGMLSPFVSELDKIAPSFRINGSQIRVLQSPTEFYETLKDKIRNAERRIFLSTLYIGKSEKELITTLQEALRSKPNLKLSILTDALRGTREAPDPSCASLLAPLVEEFGPDRVEIRMYHTPNLTGFRKKHIPKRINEGWGLQHMKLYGFDDEIMMTGANLSNDYFSDRQDRYHLFSSRDITEYFSNLHDAISSLSFRIDPSDAPSGFDMVWPKDNAAPSPLEDHKQFVRESTGLLAGLISPKTAPLTANDSTPLEKRDTSVYMLAQFSQLLSPDTSTELPAITHILSTLAAPQYSKSSWTFTAGYFNPAPSLTKLLLSTASQNNTVITASPYANGFYKSPGVSGLLPDAYTLLARRFVRAVHEKKLDASTVMKEWRKGTVGEPGAWTYHAKGLWVTLPDNNGPSISLIGSSNYTKRSYSLDLEANALIVTENESLKKQLANEQNWLQENTTVVTREDYAKTERRVGLKVRIAMLIVRLVGGAL
ncbi:CDP-diacylglycerol--glycerol-3-phosphate 3-phosphatidyltransferase [Podospora pseudoanserina]|uniref:CDP-diacylglycerol--glycerol-3-phosphate 3-phosphatidyltransferase n=1 Tax=Podospora pseudoanserina TaxID=2609844 RepID=A0ABR0IHA9_9PEZI|nr:CDP-diacylglycerol--glycerol-3-phosphate 3-phosphatidyltransferase [Podospora pseudoanserina]